MLNVQKERKNNKPITDILPGRQSFVITRNASFTAPGATVVSSLREAVNSIAAIDARKIFVLGGEKIFTQALPWTTKIHMTLVPGDHDCDKFFPVKVLNEKFEIKEGERVGDLQFITYERKFGK